MNVQELIRKLQITKGPVFAPALIREDVRWVEINKAALLRELANLPLEEDAPWVDLDTSDAPNGSYLDNN